MTFAKNFGLEEPVRTLILLTLDLEPIGAPKEVDIVHLNKIIKLYQSESDRSNIEFSNYNMGAVSYEIEETMELLMEMDIIEIDTNNRYILTELGIKMVNEIKILVSDKDVEILTKSKKMLNDLSYNELLYYMYMKFPDTKENSTQMSKLNRMKIKLINKLVEKGKINREEADEWLRE